jgi:hypothetical protein
MNPQRAVDYFSNFADAVNPVPAVACLRAALKSK